MEKSEIITEKYVAVSRETILGWLAGEGIIQVLTNLNQEDGSFQITNSFRDGNATHSKKKLTKWAYFPVNL